MEIRIGYIEQYETGYSTFLDRELTENEYLYFLVCIDELHNYENLNRLFEILYLNHSEFIEFTTRESKVLFDTSLSITGSKENYNRHFLNLNRIFLNLLTSFRTLLDHIETIIKRKYGKKSMQVNQFKDLTGYLFDNFFAYRFIYKLRNYALHCGLPIDEFLISASMVSGNKFKTKYKIDFDSKKLLTKFKEWGVVKNDFSKYETFSIFPILEELKDTMDILYKNVVSIFNIDIENAINFINENASHLKSENCEVCIFTDIKTDENNILKYFINRPIPFDIIEEHKNRKNNF